MFVEVLVVLSICFIFFIILKNMNDIVKLKAAHTISVQESTNNLKDLNSKVSKVVTKNNTINVQNLTKILNDFELANEINKRNDMKFELEIQNLRNQLNYIIENENVFKLIQKKTSDT